MSRRSPKDTPISLRLFHESRKSTAQTLRPSIEMTVPKMSALTNPVEAPAHVLSLLDRLHEESMAEEAALTDHLPNSVDLHHDLFRDKSNALNQDKCHFLYTFCRAILAKNVVEVGTSFGVSTIYLALAVGRNLASLGQPGGVIATEIESTKAQRAREHWREAGEEVERQIDLREGDFHETLAVDVPVIDLLYIDGNSSSPMLLRITDFEEYGLHWLWMP